MSDSSVATVDSCIICGNNGHDTVRIDGIKDLMDITSLQQKLNKTFKPSDILCSPCIASINSQHGTLQSCETSTKRMRSSPSEEIPSTSEHPNEAESPWDTIIVNQIPDGVEYDRFILLFSRYGTIKDTYLCHKGGGWKNERERVARITYSSEDEAWRAWEASQNKLIKYDDHVLMITLASDNYSPIQNLPDDCLEQIFLRLSSIEDKFSVEKVCKRWSRVGRISWSNLTSVSTERWSPGEWRVILSRTCNSLHDIDIDPDSPYDGDEGDEAHEFLALVAEKCERLRNLKCRLIEADYRPCALHTRTIMLKNKNLRRLQFYFIDVDIKKLNFMDVVSVQLEEMDLRTCGLGDEPYLSIPSAMDFLKFSNLRVLILESFKLNNSQLKGIGDLDNLKQLRLDHCNVHVSNFDDVVKLTKLEHLSLRHTQTPDASLAKILRNNKGLKYLNIEAIDGLTDASFMYVQQMPQLQVLVMDRLENITDAFFGGMPKIKALNCDRCFSITDAGMQKFFNSASSDIQDLRIYDCWSITVVSLVAAHEWTNRTGKTIRIWVDEDLFDYYEAAGLQNTDKIQVRTGRDYVSEEFGTEDWCVELVE